MRIESAEAVGMRYKLVLWDFDGTLADSLGCLLQIFNDAAARYGFRSIEDPESVRSLSVRAFLKQHRVPLLRLPFLIREALKLQRAEMERIRLFPDIPGVLEALHATGCRMSIVSSNSEENIRTCLRVNGVEDLFDHVVGYKRLFGKGKAVRRYLRKGRVPPADAVYIGDELRDIEAARYAGIDIAAVTWGYQAANVLTDSEPDYLIENAAHIPQILGDPALT